VKNLKEGDAGGGSTAKKNVGGGLPVNATSAIDVVVNVGVAVVAAFEKAARRGKRKINVTRIKT
jgi:hypothetical protein